MRQNISLYKKFILRLPLWKYTFDQWKRVMFPQFYYPNYFEFEHSIEENEDKWWFWEYLNGSDDVLFYD